MNCAGVFAAGGRGGECSGRVTFSEFLVDSLFLVVYLVELPFGKSLALLGRPSARGAIPASSLTIEQGEEGRVPERYACSGTFVETSY
jgi:hypothetical protein